MSNIEVSPGSKELITNYYLKCTFTYIEAEVREKIRKIAEEVASDILKDLGDLSERIRVLSKDNETLLISINLSKEEHK